MKKVEIMVNNEGSRIKKLIIILLTLTLLMALVACGQDQTLPENDNVQVERDLILTPYGNLPIDGPKVNLVLANDAVETSIHNQAMLHLSQLVDETTEGLITITVYPNAQLGSDTEILNSTLAGDIDMDLMSGALAQTIIPESCMFNIPFLNSGYDVQAINDTMINGEFRERFNTYYENAGLKLMVLSLGQSFQVNTKTPVTTLKDIKGKKIRTVPAESYMAIYQAWGANPTPLAYSELYSALQQGLVDGHDQMLFNILSVKFYEQAKYVLMTNHNYGSFTVVMNLDKFNSLPNEYQAFLKNVCDYMSDYLTTAFKEGSDSDRKALEELGVEFYDLKAEELEVWKEAGAAGIASVEAMVKNNEIIDLYKKCVEKR